MALLASTGVLTLLCQACSSHSAAPNAVYYSPERAVTELSDGQRMATATDFGSNINDLSRGTAAHLQTPSFLDRERPSVAVDAVALTEGEAAMLEQFAIAQPRPYADKALSSLDWSSASGILAFDSDRNLEAFLSPLVTDQNFSAEIAFAAPAESTGLGFDLSVAPRLAYNDEGRFSTRRVGAEVRVGQDFNFDLRGERAPIDSWYMFAGQDGEALVWKAGEHGFSNITGAMALTDQVTVGDVQAGFALQRGSGELSLSYIRREVEWRDRNGGASIDEEFAGLSFTMRR
ncbi:MAG: hypothetical protein AAGJ32_03785 [Pseudomonadota bacterium]